MGSVNNARFHALVLDDEADIRELLEITLQRMGGTSQAVGTVAEARAALDAPGNHFDICLTDMRLPDGRGLQLLHHIQQHYPALPVAVITAYGNMEDAVESLKAGAFDFVSKPVDLEILKRLIETALKLDLSDPDNAENTRNNAPRLIGNAAGMLHLRKLIHKLARSQAPVYISGESGTGKELVARMIHDEGPRAHAPFVPVNCGAIPRELMESELFGHVKGSFTGATRDKPGLFLSADGGTLFLDEIADLPAQMQVKLLRALQERRVRPVGSEAEQAVDTRVLCATHKSLAELVARGEFRQDLYYRINVIELHVPALRERPEDILELATHILERLARHYGEPTATLTDAALDALKHHPFPGNVRELENILERAVTLAEGQLIDAADLHLPELRAAAPAASAQSDANSTPPADLEGAVEQTERELINQALQQARYNKTRAAELLGISFRALRYRLKKLNID